MATNNTPVGEIGATPGMLRGTPAKSTSEADSLRVHGVRFRMAVVMCAVAAFLALAISALGRVQFPGMDGSDLTSAAWQTYRGYVPYKDLVTAVPPFYLAGGRLAFALFGVRWMAVVYITAVFSALTFYLHVPLLRRAGVRPTIAIAFAVLTQLCTSLPGSFWWYNPTTEVMACLFFAAVAGWRRQSRLDGAVVVLGSLLLLCKPNVAIVLTGLAFVFLLARHGWRKTVATYGCMGLLALLILRLWQMPVGAMLWNYHAASGRAGNLVAILSFLVFNQFWEVKQTALILIPGIIGLCILVRSLDVPSDLAQMHPALRDGFVLMTIGVATALVSTATNNSFNFTELPLALSGVTFFLLPLSRDGIGASVLRKCAMAAIAVTATCLAANAVEIAVKRLSIMEAGPNKFYQKAPLSTITAPAFFAGVEGSPALVHVLKDLDTLFLNCQSCLQRSGAVFLGPRIGFAYPTYGLEPYRGLPLWWESFSDSANPVTRIMVDRFIQAHFELAVFLHNDYTFLPDSLVDYLKTHYDVTNTQTLTIYQARK